MKKYADYVNEQCALALNENTSQIGMTDVFEGSPTMGPHHHEYWIFDETGYGRTSDALNEPSNINKETPITMVGGHVHIIKDGVCQPVGDGHTHKLLPPTKVGPDTEIFSCCKCGSHHDDVPAPAAV